MRKVVAWKIVVKKVVVRRENREREVVVDEVGGVVRKVVAWKIVVKKVVVRRENREGGMSTRSEEGGRSLEDPPHGHVSTFSFWVFE